MDYRGTTGREGGTEGLGERDDGNLPEEVSLSGEAASVGCTDCYCFSSHYPAMTFSDHMIYSHTLAGSATQPIQL